METAACDPGDANDWQQERHGRVVGTRLFERSDLQVAHFPRPLPGLALSAALARHAAAAAGCQAPRDKGHRRRGGMAGVQRRQRLGLPWRGGAEPGRGAKLERRRSAPL